VAFNLSGTNNFTTTTNVDLIIRDAYERCGISPDALTPQQITSALLSTNLILQKWANGPRTAGSLMLTTVQKCMLQLNVGQPNYYMPKGTIEILEVSAQNVTRQLGGIAFASSGIAANAFTGQSNTACVQTAPNGDIGYQWLGVQPSIYFVGIQSNVTTTYTIKIQYSFDNVTWFTALDTFANQYIIGQTLWWVIPAPINAPYMQIVEYGGATLNIQQLYFDTPDTSSGSRIIAPVSRETWISYANKTQQAVEGTFYFDTAYPPNITFYPTPDNTYTNVLYTRKRQIYDATQLTQNVDLRQIFYMALVSALAADLSLKFAVDRFDRLKMLADEEFSLACREDVQDVPIYIFPNSYATFGA